MSYPVEFEVLGVNDYHIDGNRFCSMFVMESDPEDKSLKGYRPAKMKIKPAVADAMPEGEGAYPGKFTFLCQSVAKQGKIEMIVHALAPGSSGLTPSTKKAS